MKLFKLLSTHRINRKLCLILSLSSLLGLGAAYEVQADGPFPSLDTINIPTELAYPGQPFEIEVWASNVGSEAEGGGSITLSLPEGHPVSILDADVPILPESWSDCDYSVPHAWMVGPSTPCNRALKHNTNCQGQVNLQYPLAESWHKPWGAGERHYLKVQVKPSPNVNRVTIYFRVAMRAGTRGCDLRLAPDSASRTDQQGFPVREFVVVVSSPTPTQTPIPPPTSTATPTPIPPTATSVPPTSTPIPPTPASPTTASVAVIPASTAGAVAAPATTPPTINPIPRTAILAVLVGLTLTGLALLGLIFGQRFWPGQGSGHQRVPWSKGPRGTPPQLGWQPPPPQPYQPVCLNCGANFRPEALFCTACGIAIPVIGKRYQVLNQLGQGGMAAVYLVQDKRIPGKRWAVKEMSDAAIATPAERQQAIDAFRQEAQLLARLNHVNLPRVTDFLSEGDHHYLVMDFIEGQTLEELLSQRTGPFSEAEVLGWASQLCDVLSYLHVQHPPVIFRDLKPGNIMVDQDGYLKLIDFGIARLFKPGQSGDTTHLGTPGYSPPEQYGQGQTDARSDIYALGVTMHQLLTKHDPTTTPFTLPKMRQLNAKVSIKTEAVIEQATRLNATRRFQTTAELRQALGLN